jgi:putative component of membrane protein insertase Oxa1/YidC/SpoIIIJ protein YidD
MAKTVLGNIVRHGAVIGLGLIPVILLCGCSTASPLSSAVRFYQGPLNHLSAVKSSECPMYPSCSEYSRECIQKHGSAIGWMMTVDRLMRCGRDDMRLLPRVVVDGKVKYFDPVSENDFWWDGSSYTQLTKEVETSQGSSMR